MSDVVIVGTVVAFVAWGVMFAGNRSHFWPRATVASATVLIYAVAAGPSRIGHLFAHGNWLIEVVVGVAAGVGLYVVFWVGEQLLVVALPTLAAEVADLYQARRGTSRLVIVAILTLAAPAEELFYRGFLWERSGVVIGLVVYGLVHLWERKVILIAAAVAGGAWWGVLFALTGGLVAPVVCHLVWCLLIIAWRPAVPTAAARRLSDRVHGGTVPTLEDSRAGGPGAGPA